MYEKLEALLRKHKTSLLEIHTGTIGGKETSKRQLHLYGKKEVAVGGRKPQQTYVVGIIEQKNFVGLYFMPIYSHPREFKSMDANLQKALEGKSCFHLTEEHMDSLAEISRTIDLGIQLYKKEGWI